MHIGPGDLPVDVWEQQVEVNVVGLQCDCCLIDVQLVLGKVDNAGSEGLYSQSLTRPHIVYTSKIAPS